MKEKPKPILDYFTARLKGKQTRGVEFLFNYNSKFVTKSWSKVHQISSSLKCTQYTCWILYKICDLNHVLYTQMYYTQLCHPMWSKASCFGKDFSSWYTSWLVSWREGKVSDVTVDYATVDVFQPDVIPWKKRSEDFKKLLKGELTCSVLGDFEDFEVEEDVSLTPRIG